MARRAKKGEDPDALAGSLTDKKRIIADAAREIVSLELERKGVGERISDVRGRIKSAGILQADFNAVLRLWKLEGDDRATSLDAIRICFEAMGIGAQGSLFPEAAAGTAPTAKPEVRVETRGRKGAKKNGAETQKPTDIADFKAQKEAAKAAGRQAFKDGKTLDDCPYEDEPLRVAWVTSFDLEAEETEAAAKGKGGKGKTNLAAEQPAGRA